MHRGPLVVWRRSRACSDAGCIEVARIGRDIAVRDSKVPGSPVLTYSSDEWRDFIAGVKAGEFDDLAVDA